MAQQKQRNQLHLTNDKNIFTYCFQLIQRLQPNSKIYTIRNFMYTKQAQQRQPKIKDIHTATTTYTTQFYQSYIANNKSNKRNLNNQSNYINVNFTNNTKFMRLQMRQRKFCSVHIENLQEIGRFHTFHPSQILYT